jgi:outer membrane protein TolC
MLAPHPGAARAHLPPTASLLTALVALGACAAPGPRPLDLAGLATDVPARAATPEQVAEALDLADLRALPFERPVLAGEPDYDGGAFWHASALAFNSALRSARRRWAEASARARSAGAPEAAELELEQMGFDSGERETWLALTFDVLGLLDAGRSAAAHELSRAEARAAWADVESTAWATRIAVDRARTRLGDALAKIELLTGLLASSDASVTRAELLFERGRLSAGELARLRGMVAEVAHELHLRRVELTRHRRALADAAGLPPNAPALDGPTRATLDGLIRAAELASAPDARELLERSPLLRRARLEYAVAEAVLRGEVARTRPGLRLGPALQVMPDETLPGGMLVLDLPHALALSGRVEAARQARERVREELEEALRASLARIEQARAEHGATRQALVEHALPREAETGTAWRAAQARFEVDPAAVEEVGMALRDRAMALLELLDVRHESVLAWLDLEEVIGPGPRPLPGDEALADARSAGSTAEVRR